MNLWLELPFIFNWMSCCLAQSMIVTVKWQANTSQWQWVAGGFKDLGHRLCRSAPALLAGCLVAGPVCGLAGDAVVPHRTACTAAPGAGRRLGCEVVEALPALLGTVRPVRSTAQHRHPPGVPDLTSGPSMAERVHTVPT